MKTIEEPGNDEIVFCAGVLAGMISHVKGDTFKKFLDDVSCWLLGITSNCSVAEYYKKKFGVVEFDAMIKEHEQQTGKAITPDELSKLKKAFDTVRARVREEELPK